MSSRMRCTESGDRTDAHAAGAEHGRGPGERRALMVVRMSASASLYMSLGPHATLSRASRSLPWRISTEAAAGWA